MASVVASCEAVEGAAGAAGDLPEEKDDDAAALGPLDDLGAVGEAASRIQDPMNQAASGEGRNLDAFTLPDLSFLCRASRIDLIPL
jgi:hypothetical protein